MDRKRAKAELEQIYGSVAPDKQLSLDVAFDALGEDPKTIYTKGYYEALENGIKKKFIKLERAEIFDEICKKIAGVEE